MLTLALLLPSAVAGAAIDHHQPIKGALIGAAVGEGVQIIRNHKAH